MNTPIAGIDYDLDLPKGYLSPSQIELYLHCPEKYRRQYVEKQEEDYNENLAEGQAFHRVMRETNLAYARKKTHITLERAVRFHKQFVKEESAKLNGRLKRGQDRVDVSEMLKRGEKFLTKAWGKRGPIWRPCMMDGNVPGVEWEWKMNLAGVPVQGICDLVEETNCTDYKVASSARDWNKKPKYDPLLSLQANCYRLAAQRHRFCFEVFEKTTGQIVLLSAKVDDLSPIEEWLTFTIANVAKGISQKVFPPTTPEKSFLCDKRWCGFWSECAGMLAGEQK